MQLFQIPAPPQDLACTPEKEALAERDNLLAIATSIQVVTKAKQNDDVAVIGSNIQKLLKGVEAARKDLTAPYLAAQRSIKATADAFCEPLSAALLRLGRLASVYRQEQERLAEVERRKRAEEIARLQEQERLAAEKARQASESGDIMGTLMADIQASALAVATTAAVVAPPPEAPKTAGQSFQDRVLAWECTDPVALWNAAPQLCNPPTPKASAIKSTCTPERPVPGLKLWWESKTVFKSR